MTMSGDPGERSGSRQAAELTRIQCGLRRQLLNAGKPVRGSRAREPYSGGLPPALGSLVSNAKVIANWVQPGAEPYETLNPCGTIASVQHGTHVTGTIAGDSGATATPLLANADVGDGMAPNAQILFQDIGADCLVVDDYAATLMQARAGGAHIHNNSWGAGTGNAYTGYDFDADDTT